MEYGGITPIGLPDAWPVLVDPAVVDLPYVLVAAAGDAASCWCRGRRSRGCRVRWWWPVWASTDVSGTPAEPVSVVGVPADVQLGEGRRGGGGVQDAAQPGRVAPARNGSPEDAPCSISDSHCENSWYCQTRRRHASE